MPTRMACRISWIRLPRSPGGELKNWDRNRESCAYREWTLSEARKSFARRVRHAGFLPGDLLMEAVRA